MKLCIEKGYMFHVLFRCLGNWEMKSVENKSDLAMHKLIPTIRKRPTT
jgi:hypothetical protein